MIEDITKPICKIQNNREKEILDLRNQVTLINKEMKKMKIDSFINKNIQKNFSEANRHIKKVDVNFELM